jgi:hypothetical protein
MSSLLRTEVAAFAAAETASLEQIVARQSADERWVFEGWKAFLERSVMNERIRAAILADVMKAQGEAKRRRAIGLAAHPHPIMVMGKVLGGLSERVQRVARDPIRKSEMAEIRSALEKLDEIAGEYAIATGAAEAMVADGRRAYGFTPIDSASEATQRFGDVDHYLGAEAKRLGFPADLARRTRHCSEIHRVATRLGQLYERYRRAAKDENGVAVTQPSELAQIHAELGLAADEEAKLNALAGAADAMIEECRQCLRLDKPTGPQPSGSSIDADSVAGRPGNFHR